MLKRLFGFPRKNAFLIYLNSVASLSKDLRSNISWGSTHCEQRLPDCHSEPKVCQLQRLQRVFHKSFVLQLSVPTLVVCRSMTKRFSGLMSRWHIIRSCRYWGQKSSYGCARLVDTYLNRRIGAMIPVGRPPSRGSYPWQRPPCILCPWLSRQTGPRPGFIKCYKWRQIRWWVVVTWTYSMTRYFSPGKSKTSSNWMMLGWSIAVKMEISLSIMCSFPWHFACIKQNG